MKKCLPAKIRSLSRSLNELRRKVKIGGVEGYERVYKQVIESPRSHLGTLGT